MHQSSLERVVGIQISPFSRDCRYRELAAEIISASSLSRVDGVNYGINDSFARGAFCAPNESPICIRAQSGVAVDSKREGFVSLARALDRMARGILVAAGTERAVSYTHLCCWSSAVFALIWAVSPPSSAFLRPSLCFDAFLRERSKKTVRG